MLALQLLLLVRVVGQLLVCAKSPLAVIDWISTPAVPLPVIVRKEGRLVVPTGCEGNATLVADNLMLLPVIVPVRLTLCGTSLALSLIDRIAVSLLKVSDGENATVIMQFAPGSIAPPQLFN